MTTTTKAPKLTADQCKAIHGEAHAAGVAAANTNETWSGCGFAWVLVKPATSTFARWLKAQSIGSYSQYNKGMMVWVSQYGQHGGKKWSYAAAYSYVLQKHGIRANAECRDD